MCMVFACINKSIASTVRICCYFHIRAFFLSFSPSLSVSYYSAIVCFETKYSIVYLKHFLFICECITLALVSVFVRVLTSTALFWKQIMKTRNIDREWEKLRGLLCESSVFYSIVAMQLIELQWAAVLSYTVRLNAYSAKRHSSTGNFVFETKRQNKIYFELTWSDSQRPENFATNLRWWSCPLS